MSQVVRGPSGSPVVFFCWLRYLYPKASPSKHGLHMSEHQQRLMVWVFFCWLRFLYPKGSPSKHGLLMSEHQQRLMVLLDRFVVSGQCRHLVKWNSSLCHRRVTSKWQKRLGKGKESFVHTTKRLLYVPLCSTLSKYVTCTTVKDVLSPLLFTGPPLFVLNVYKKV